MSYRMIYFGKKAAYRRETPLCIDYIKEIKEWRQRETGPPLPPREDLIDHLWTNIFGLYFQMRRGAPYIFGIERESYITNDSQTRSDISIVHRSGDPLTRRKAIILEAKRPYGDGIDSAPSEELWQQVKDQLGEYMRRAADAETLESHRRKPMFGITAIGLYARMFEFSKQSRELRPIRGGGTLHVKRHSVAIEGFLKRWVKEIEKAC